MWEFESKCLGYGSSREFDQKNAHCPYAMDCYCLVLSVMIDGSFCFESPLFSLYLMPPPFEMFVFSFEPDPRSDDFPVRI